MGQGTAGDIRGAVGPSLGRHPIDSRCRDENLLESLVQNGDRRRKRVTVLLHIPGPSLSLVVPGQAARQEGSQRSSHGAGSSHAESARSGPGLAEASFRHNGYLPNALALHIENRHHAGAAVFVGPSRRSVTGSGCD